jgi:hypothetical protein
MSYIFIKTRDTKNQHDNTNITIEIPDNDVTLETVLEALEEYLKACGFILNGTLDIVSDDEEQT